MRLVISNICIITGKNEVEEYITSIGLPATFIYVACYMSNLGAMFPLVPNDDGTQTLKIPEVKEDTYFDLVDTASDTGPLVRAVLQNRDSCLGKRIPVVGERIMFKDIAATFSKGKVKNRVSHTSRTRTNFQMAFSQ
jgi:hypothetical protein